VLEALAIRDGALGDLKISVIAEATPLTATPVSTSWSCVE
jgi:hypothetical protein